jgi:hypothetical protein
MATRIPHFISSIRNVQTLEEEGIFIVDKVAHILTIIRDHLIKDKPPLNQTFHILYIR